MNVQEINKLKSLTQENILIELTWIFKFKLTKQFVKWTEINQTKAVFTYELQTVSEGLGLNIVRVCFVTPLTRNCPCQKYSHLLEIFCLI